MSVEVKIESSLHFVRKARPKTACEREALERLASGQQSLRDVRIELRAMMFSKRENDIMRELIAGHGGSSNAQIGARLGIAEGTVKVYFQKLGVKLGRMLGASKCLNRTAIAIWAVRRWEDQSGREQRGEFS